MPGVCLGSTGGTIHARSDYGTEARAHIEPNEGDKRYIRRDENGQFTKDQVDVGRSLAADQRLRVKAATLRIVKTHAPALDYLKDK